MIMYRWTNFDTIGIILMAAFFYGRKFYRRDHPKRPKRPEWAD